MQLRDWTIVRILASVATKIWAASFAALLACFIVYCFYGFFMAFSFSLAAIAGILYQTQDTLLYHPEQPPHSRVFIPVPSMFGIGLADIFHWFLTELRFCCLGFPQSFDFSLLVLSVDPWNKMIALHIAGLPYESVNIRSTDGVILHAFLIRHNGDKGRFVPTIVYLHGNAGNMGHRLQNASGMFHTLQCNLLMIDYRGYGLSTGTPIEQGLYNDARAAIDYLHTRHDLDLSQIVLFGRSLGGAVAIDVASDPEYYQKLMCVMLENTFTSIPEMAVSLIHQSIKYFPLFMFKNLYISIQKIQFFAAPCLFVSGMADTLVPPKMMLQLHARCGSRRKQLIQIKGGSHNDTWATAGYYQGLAQFLTECKETRTPLQTAPALRSKWPQVEDL
ncbi:Protein ABHD13 [Pseudolycoriella hygida]|uniref:Protein ABHD13 n=1 Tax=Pseudolycoriella hygida TaxID=35572 RepID=A0A9Q0S8T8_9DIPT|nr:Protein ABHD13 [Pseudolycoriella hygida]